MSERKLLSVQQVAEIAPIEGADAIEHVRIGGWWTRKVAVRLAILLDTPRLTHLSQPSLRHTSAKAKSLVNIKESKANVYGQ